MKDTIITGEAKKRELWILLGCFLVANLVNIACIIGYGTSFSEVFTQIGYVVCITGVLYALMWLVRLVAGLFRRKSR